MTVLIDSVIESVPCSKNELITNVGIIAVNVYSLDSLFQNISRQNAELI